MKIVDIISESTNEGLGSTLAKAGAWMLGNGSRAQALEKLASKMARRGGTVSAAEAEAIVGNTLANDAQFMAKAEKIAAKKIADAEYAANVAAIKASMKAVGNWIEVFRKLAMYPIIGWMFANPLITYKRNMEAAQKLLDSGQATSEDFDAYHRREMAVLVGKWAAVFTAGTIAKLPVGVVSTVLSKIGLKGIASGFSKWVGTPAMIVAMGYVSQPDIAQDIANFMASNIFGQAVGYLGVKTEDAILGAISDKLKYGKPGATDAGQGGKQDTSAAQDIGASSQEPSGTGSTDNTTSNSGYDRPLFKGFK